jgi:hypothetical protein
VSRRRWVLLALTPFPLALASIYVLFFAEVRYHLAIAVFLFPFAGLAWRWLIQGVRDAIMRRLNDRGRRRLAREALLGLVLVAGVFAGWRELLEWSARLRETHRWGVAVCHMPERDRLCEWRPTIPAPGEGASGVRGVWDGIGLRVTTALAAAATQVHLAPGRYRVSVRAQGAAPGSIADARITLKVGGAALAEAEVPAPEPRLLAGNFEHRGGILEVEALAERLSTIGPSPTVWLSDLKIEAEFH